MNNIGQLRFCIRNYRRRRAVGLMLWICGCLPLRGLCGENLPPDFTLEFQPDKTEGSFELTAKEDGLRNVLIRGLHGGGDVEIKVGDVIPKSVELRATGGMRQGKADCAWVVARLKQGINQVSVVEKEGVQIVHVPDSGQWFGASSDAGEKVRFSVDFDQMRRHEIEFPVIVYFGPKDQEFFHLSGKLDHYATESYASDISEVSGGSGEQQAALNYIASDPGSGLRTLTQLTLVRGELEDNFILRVRQKVHAEAAPRWKDNVEFLHVMVSATYGQDWGDGIPDWVWYRTPKEGGPDAFAGSRTALSRVRDYSARTYSFASSTVDPAARSLSGAHHTGAAAVMEAPATVGGWFSKSGVGSCGLVFSRYHANFRGDLRPLISHCGDGADTHFYLFWGDLFRPFGMAKGDVVDIEYSLCFVPTEPLLTEVMDLNEGDLQLFGDQSVQRSPIDHWLGSKKALGLVRTDGSSIFLGITGKSGESPGIPIQSVKSTKAAYQLSDLGRVKLVKLEPRGDRLDVVPGEYTIIDCGALLLNPSP